MSDAEMENSKREFGILYYNMANKKNSISSFEGN